MLKSVLTTPKTHCISLTKTSRLVSIRELLAVFMIITKKAHKYTLCVKDEVFECDS